MFTDEEFETPYGGGRRGRGRSGHGGPGGHGGHAMPGGAGGPEGRGGRGRGGAPGGGRGRRGGWQNADAPAADDAAAWFAAAVPDDWYEGGPSVAVDRDEIWVTGRLRAVEGETDEAYESGGADENREKNDREGGQDGATVGPVEASARIAAWREATRSERVRIARTAEQRYGRKVSWGAGVAGTDEMFTHLAVPVMTRLRQPERQVLDTLVDAGVARSRADALAWCVRLVGDNVSDWLGELREAMRAVDDVRARGPFNA